MINIGIICPSEIAFRRFLPALVQLKEFHYSGVAVASECEWYGENYDQIEINIREKIMESEMDKAKKIQQEYGGKIYNSYQTLIESNDIDAIYIPLPPALHYKWAQSALSEKKHVFVEKPSTTSLLDTMKLIAVAQKAQLALHENYMFVFHKQLEEIKEIVKGGTLGQIRLYSIKFGFPKRSKNDFRYSSKLGGGALLDCGGYALKYANMLLDNDAEILYAKKNYTTEFDVDMYGSAALCNKRGDTVQISFGMDNSYKCELEIWGSEGVLKSERILTAPAGFIPSCTINKNNILEDITLSPDDTFLKSLEYFYKCINDRMTRIESYKNMEQQQRLVEEFLKRAME